SSFASSYGMYEDVRKIRQRGKIVERKQACDALTAADIHMDCYHTLLASVGGRIDLLHHSAFDSSIKLILNLLIYLLMLSSFKNSLHAYRSFQEHHILYLKGQYKLIW